MDVDVVKEEEVDEESKLIEHKKVVEEPTLFLSLKVEPMGENSTWYFDNGASNHMICDKSKFVELDNNIMGHVRFCDNTKMKSNILTIGQILESGYKITMEDCFLWLRDREVNLIAKVIMTKNRMFMLDMKNIGATCLKACVKDPSWIWHMRLGHLNFGGERLGREEYGEGNIFPNQSTRRATTPHELIHADMCGLSSLNLLTENVYEIKALQTDQGGEFTSYEFKIFFAKDMNLTVPRSPQ
ncbi:uncharacterized protein [Aristolochia californica]|uniref:uncharacterized protein n=1 Tax=Aristolochia californica TaxID=171875 RepID=UPI0035DED742